MDISSGVANQTKFDYSFPLHSNMNASDVPVTMETNSTYMISNMSGYHGDDMTTPVDIKPDRTDLIFDRDSITNATTQWDDVIGSTASSTAVSSDSTASTIINNTTTWSGASTNASEFNNSSTEWLLGGLFVTNGSHVTDETPRLDIEDEFTGLHNIARTLPDEPSANLAPLGLVVIIALTVIGNVIVCVAVKMDKRLHHMTYFFFVSMAVLHILMAGTLMPPATMVVLTGSFTYSEDICKVWVTLDFFFCNCTCLHLAFVNMDTFLRLKDPLRNGGRIITKCSLLLWIGASWVISIVQSIAQFMLSQNDHGILREGICFISDKNFIILGMLFSFLIPMVISVTFYGLCVNELRVQRSGKFLDDSEATLQHAFQYASLESIPDDISDDSSCVSETEAIADIEQEQVQLAVVTNIKHDINQHQASINPPKRQCACGKNTEETTSFCNEMYSHLEPKSGDECSALNCHHHQQDVSSADQAATCTLLLRDQITPDQSNNGLLSGQIRPNAEHDHKSPDAAIRQEVAISRLMFLLLLLSITLWIPYSASNLVYGICKHCSQNMTFDEMMTFKWIAYCCGMIGPLIYVKFSEPLRDAIWSMFFCKYCRWEEC